MSAKPDMSNPLIATPVATIATQLFVQAMSTGIVTTDRLSNLKHGCVTAAEELVGVLLDRGHLPLTTETEEPKQGDAELVLAAMLHGVAHWQFYGPGDPRGTLSIGLGPARYTHTTKLVKGVPHLSDAAREQLEQNISPFLRRL